MELTAKQRADYAKLRAYYPYRLFFLVTESDAPEGVIWALRDRRSVNKAVRRGATVFEIT